MLLAFWLANVLRATAACHFSCLLWAATSAPAALASLLFDPADAQIIEKTAFRDFPNISRVWIFFLLTFAQLHLLSSDSTSLLCFSSSSVLCFFQLSILLSEVRLLNFVWLKSNIHTSQPFPHAYLQRKATFDPEAALCLRYLGTHGLSSAGCWDLLHGTWWEVTWLTSRRYLGALEIEEVVYTTGKVEDGTPKSQM